MRTLSPERKRVREALRVAETEEHLRSIHADDLAERARVSHEDAIRFARLDLTAGIRKMRLLLPELDLDSKPAEEQFIMGRDRNPYPMWWNLTTEFHEAILVRLTLERFKKRLGRHEWRQTRERWTKIEELEGIREASPILSKELKPLPKLKAGPTNP